MIENSELRNGWAWASVDDLCDLNPRHKAGIPDEREVSFVPMAAVSDSLGKIIKLEARPYREVKSGYTPFAEGDVVWAKITPCMENGKSAVAKGLVNGLACGTTEFFVLRSKGAIIPELLHYYIRQESYRRQAQRTMKSGVGQARVPKEFLLQTQIPIPPLPEQRRIVAKIEALQERSRKARAALEAIPPLLEQFRQSVLAAAFRGDLTADWRAQHPDIEPASVLLDRIRADRRRRWEEAELSKMQAKGKMPKDEKWKERYKEPEAVDETELPELPEGWRWIALEELGTHLSGASYKSGDFTKQGVQVVRLGNLYQGRFDLSRNPVFLPPDHTEIESARVSDGDLLISQTGTRHKRDYGNFVLIPDGTGNLALNQRVLAVSLYLESLQEWVLHASRLAVYRNHFFSQETGGVNQGNVGIAGVMRGPIPLAPLDEVSIIVRHLKEISASIDQVQEVYQEGIQQIEMLDQSILAKAFRGELVPQDPNDEPASVLLERIRTEREAQSAKPRAKKKTPGSTKHTKKAPPVSVNENDALPLFNSLQK